MTPSTPPPLPSDAVGSVEVRPPTVTRTPPAGRKFPCPRCGARLDFDPSAQALQCPYCGHSEIIEPSAKDVEERDWATYWDNHSGTEETIAGRSSEVKCTVCGAVVLLDDTVAADKCPYCNTFLENHPESAQAMIPPGALLPFAVSQREARTAFQQWIATRWFAPNSLRRLANLGRLSGVYAPYWTFDSMTCTQYTGQRGDDYTVTQTYTDRDANGNAVTRTQTVVHTRWSYAAGEVRHFFDDVLVYASHSLPANFVAGLAPWDLPKTEPFQPQFLSGFQTERYTVGLSLGFDAARNIMDQEIRRLCMQDIGGDHQRLDSVHTQHVGVTFKHILLPIWVAAYRYHHQLHRILINGRTAEVIGSRPYSWVKIVSLIVTLLLALGALLWWTNR